jgi:hypothetical protein
VVGPDSVPQYKNSVILKGIPLVFGHYPLPFAHVEIFGPMGWMVGGAASTPALEYSAMRPNELARSRQGFELQFRPGNETQEISHVFINTPNASYEERVVMDKVGEGWEFDARLFKAASKTPIKVLTSPGFPKGLK